MINFDSLTLKLFEKENKNFFEGAKVQKVQQPSRNELIFHIRNKGESRKFYINFNPNFYHLCFMSQENEKRRNIIIPKTAPMFCMLLRKYIQNSKIARIEVPDGERIFEIYFEYFDELNERYLLCLAIELMGKHSNVILYNYDTNVIIGCGHNVSSEKSRERELYGSLPYIYPPKQKKKNLLKTSFDVFCKNADMNDIQNSISSKYYYLTKANVEQIVNSLSNVTVENVYDELSKFLANNEFYYCISSDYSQYSLFKTPLCIKQNSINEMIDNYFSYHQEISVKKNILSKILKITQTQLKKLNLLKTAQNAQTEKIEKALLYKTKADVLSANLYYIKQGLKKAELIDFAGNNIIIELDENLSPIENVNRYYSLYKKFKSANEHAQILLNETLSQILYYEEIEFFAKQTDNIDELNEIYSQLVADNPQAILTVQKVESINIDGYTVYFGKNKNQNDYILSKLSTGEDLWFHPLNAAGAHVIIKITDKTSVPNSVLLKTAQLTKKLSSQNNNSKTSIIYTKRKYVKKANNKKAFVTYKNEIEIVV